MALWRRKRGRVSWGQADENCSICRVRNAICRSMAPKPGPPSSPPAQRLFAKLSRLAVFFLALLVPQICRADDAAGAYDKATDAYDKGVTASNRGDSDLAIANFSEAIRLDTNYAFAYYSRASEYHSKGDDDKAIADYSKF